MAATEDKTGDPMINKAVELGLTNRLEEVASVTVDVQGDPLRALTGKVDSVSVQGQGLVINQEMRVEELDIRSDGISLNPLSALFGKLKLTKSVNTTARVVLVEDDLNHLLASASVRDNLQDIEISVGGEAVRGSVERLSIHLREDGGLFLIARVLMGEGREPETLVLGGKPCGGVREDSLCLQEPEVHLGRLHLQIQAMEVDEEQLTLQVQVHFRPGTNRPAEAGPPPAPQDGEPTVKVRTGGLALDQIDIAHVTQAQARLAVPQQSLNRLLASRYIQGNLQNLSVQIGDQPVVAHVEELAIDLQPGTIRLGGRVRTQGTERSHFELRAMLRSDGGGVYFEEVYLAAAGLELHLRQFEVKAGKLTLQFGVQTGGRQTT